MTVYNATADTTYITADSTLFTADIDPFALSPAGTKSADDYMALITPWQANPIKARFLATVRAGVQPYADGQAINASLSQAFDLDEAIGAQLDVDGQWIGRTRNVPTPVPNILFSFDRTNLGFEQGYWQGPYDSSAGISQLPDLDYRRLLYAKVLANSWDGTVDDAIAILRSYFADPASIIFVDDRAIAAPFDPINNTFAFDVTGRGFDQGVWQPPFGDLRVPDAAPLGYSVCIAGRIPSKIDLYILGNDLLPVRAIGADVDYSVTTVDGSALFGFDMSNDHVGGFDGGAWGADPFTVASLLP